MWLIFADNGTNNSITTSTTYFQYSTSQFPQVAPPYTTFPSICATSLPPGGDFLPTAYHQHQQLYPASSLSQVGPLAVPSVNASSVTACPCGQCASQQLHQQQLPPTTPGHHLQQQHPHLYALAGQLPAGTLIVNRFTEINYFDNPNIVKQAHCDMVSEYLQNIYFLLVIFFTYLVVFITHLLDFITRLVFFIIIF